MKKLFVSMAAITLLGIGVVAQASVETFEGFTVGASINAQNGFTAADQWGNKNDWSPATGIQRPDEQIVDLNGNKVWRISNGYSSSSYSDQPFSQRSEAVAGELGSSLWNDFGPDNIHPQKNFGANATTNRFRTSFDFRSVTGAAQSGLALTVSPSAKQAPVRMSYLRILDNGNTGFDLAFNGDYGTITVASGLSYTDWHSIAMDITFVNGVDNIGGVIYGNDIVKTYVDGTLVHTGTTWESYYYDYERIVETSPRLQAVDSTLFRLSTAAPATMDNGFYFDNIEVSNSPAAVPEPGTILAALSILGPAGMIFRRRKA